MLGTVVPECPVIPLGERVDCFPDAGASKLGCLQRGCCWSPLDERNAPWCFFSTNHGYSVVRLSALLKRKVAPSLFGEDIEELAFHADLQTVNRLRFKISDAHKQRFEVPHEHIKPPATHPSGSFNYEVELTHNPFGFQVRRAATKKLVTWLMCCGTLEDSRVLAHSVFDKYCVVMTLTFNSYSHNDYYSLSASLLSQDIQYTDIDYMEDKKDFTYDEVNFKGLPQFADYLHEKGQKYILILDPAIATSKRINGPYEAYDRGTQKNAWVTEADGKTPLVGEVGGEGGGGAFTNVYGADHNSWLNDVFYPHD
uniref:P-type domain-containing protein n=1 Tax=Oncorhynchus kisutch TaxID=8019 RepID=A0A8C7K1C6_ONCKI